MHFWNTACGASLMLSFWRKLLAKIDTKTLSVCALGFMSIAGETPN
jgi:hypothetical protein